MTIQSGDKHQFIQFTSATLNEAEIEQFSCKIEEVTEDLIIDLSAVKNVDDGMVNQFILAVGAALDEKIVILVGNEDELEELGFLADEFPVTPTYNEAVDFLFMLQLEKDLGLEE